MTGSKLDLATLPAVPSATNAQNAVNAQTAANLSNLYFAVVKADGTLARGTAGVSSQPAGGGNSYRVSLPAGTDTKTCFFVGSLGGNNPGNNVVGEISVNPSATFPGNAMFISTFDSSGAGAGKEFTVMARC